jgi:hypothetical protein
LARTGHFSGEASGQFGQSTLTALRALYKAAGYDPPLADGADPGFALGEFVEVASEPADVVQAAPAGTVLTAGVPVATLVVGEPSVTARATILDVDALAEGAAVTVSAPGVEPLAAVVGAVSEYREDGSPGYDLTIALPMQWYEASGGVRQATVESAEPVPLGPAVPLTAVRQDAAGAYVLAAGQTGLSDAAGSGDAAESGRGAGTAGAETFERVALTVVGQAGGYALIESDGALAPGRRIVVTGDTSAAP